MGRLNVVIALIRKEGIQIVRDPSSLITAFVLPVFLLVLYASGASLDLVQIPIGVVMEDSSPLAQGLVQSLDASEFLHVTLRGDRVAMGNALAGSKIRGFVVIPDDFTSKFHSTALKAELQVIADGSEPNTAQFVQQYVRGVVAAWDPAGTPPPVLVQPRIWYNEELVSQNFLIPGSLVLVMTLTGALLTALVVAREWEKGTMEALMATPISMFEILFSKFVTYLLLSMASLLLCLWVAHNVYNVPFRGSVMAMALSSLPYMIFAVETGLVLSSLTRNQFLAVQVTLVTTYLPAFMLSGFIFDIDSMPWIIQLVTYLVPARYFVSNLKTLFLVGDVWELLLPNILILLAFCALLALIIKRWSGKRLDI